MYIYCVSLEKLSYNMINNFYISYYNAYNEIKETLLTKKNDKKNYIIFTNLRDLNNSDLSVFYLSYSIFYQNNVVYKGELINYIKENRDKKELLQEYSYLKENLYKKSILILNHFKSITYYYVKMLIYLAKGK